MLNITKKEFERLENYIRYVEVTPETIRNEILEILLNRDECGISEPIEKLATEFLDGPIPTFEGLIDFIENIDLNKVTINGVLNIKKFGEN